MKKYRLTLRKFSKYKLLNHLKKKDCNQIDEKIKHFWKCAQCQIYKKKIKCRFKKFLKKVKDS